MSKLESTDIRTGEQYESVRQDARRSNSSLRENRRVQLGDRVSVVFENRETVRNIIEETLRSERVSDSQAVEHEVESFNPFVPGERELMVTLFLEAQDPVELSNLAGDFADLPQHIHLEADGQRFEAQPVMSSEGSADPAYCLKFTLNDEARNSFANGIVVLVADHPACRSRVELSDELKRQLGSEI